MNGGAEEEEAGEEDQETKQKRLKAILATLMVHFRKDAEQIARMTRRQVLDFYWHKRNKDGGIDIPGWEPVMRAKSETGTLESDLATVAMLEMMLGGLVKPGSGDTARETLRKKYAPPDTSEVTPDASAG